MIITADRPGNGSAARICSCFVQNVHLINRFGFCIALLSANQRPLLANEGHFISLAERRIVHVRPSRCHRPRSVLFSRLHSSSASKHFSFPLKGTSPKPPPLFPSLPSLETCWSAPRNRSNARCCCISQPFTVCMPAKSGIGSS